MKKYILALVMAVLIAQPALCKPRVSYDRFADSQIARTRSYSPFGIALEVAAGITTARISFFKTDNPTGQLCGLHFESLSDRWVFLRNDTLYLLVDGERFQFDPITQERNARYGSVSEILNYNLPCDMLKAIVDSKLTEGRLGPGMFTFVIKENAKSEINELLSVKQPNPELSGN